MTERLDAQGEAREALSSVAADYGPRVLSDPRMLGNLVTDLLPDLPRERSLLVTAAETGVAGELTSLVEEHHLDPDTAVQMVAQSLTDRRFLDQAASMWVTAEYAQALGYQVRSDATPASSSASPPAGSTAPVNDQFGSHQQTASTQDPAGGYPPSTETQQPAGGHLPPGPWANQAPVGQPPVGQPPVGQPPTGSQPGSCPRDRPGSAVAGPSLPPPAPPRPW